MLAQDIPDSSPFRLENAKAYSRWRDAKLHVAGESLLVPVADPARLTDREYVALLSKLRKRNMAVYQCARPDAVDKESIRRFGRRFGLQRLDPNFLADDDGITSLTTEARKSERGYIPYSDKRLLWHTDGYYNPPERQIRAMILHTVQDAGNGGENRLLDHELVYLLMRDTNPEFIRALMQPRAMTIPANTEAGGKIRPVQAGPVFSVDGESGDLHMRYTARTKSIEWAADSLTSQAVSCLEEILADSGYIIEHRMSPGEGLICNNVLHNRAAFEDDTDAGKRRLLYRARYYDRIEHTHWHQLND